MYDCVVSDSPQIVSYADAMDEPPNRIRELREARGISSEELARRIREKFPGETCSGATIRRLESLKKADKKGQGLTVKYMVMIADVLDVRTVDLMTSALIAGAEDEVILDENDPLASQLAIIGKRIYRVTRAGDEMTGVGIKPGDPIVIDETPERIAALHSLDIVLARVSSPEDKISALVLRQYIAPDLLINNSPGASLMGRTTDPRVQILGVAIRK